MAEQAIRFYDICQDEIRDATQADFDLANRAVQHQAAFIGDSLWAHGIAGRSHNDGEPYSDYRLSLRVLTPTGAKYFGAVADGNSGRPNSDAVLQMLRDLADQIEKDKAPPT